MIAYVTAGPSLKAKAIVPSSNAEPVLFLDQPRGDTATKQALDVTTTPSGVICIITKHGAGRQPKPGEIVLLQATALLENGKTFRKPQGGNEPDWIWLLPDKQPEGVIEGMSLLHVGDSAILIVPPALGYGAEGGRGGLVPRNAVLTYFVDILDVKSDDLASMLLNTIETSGIDDALKQYDDLKGRGFPDIHVSEVNMNGLGYRLLKTDRKAAAIKIFQLNVEAYPHSANAYDSLGEAYASSGDKQRAIANYEKALSIDPQKESSAAALKQLKSN
jgi:tetratricopeptide (TPR) repeat protein